MAYMVKALQQGKEPTEAEAYADTKMAGTSRTIIDVILSAYEHLTSNTLHLMREIKSGQSTLKKLSESEGHLQGVLDYAKVGMWEFHYQGTTANWSPEMYQIFGLANDAVPGPETLCGIIGSKEHSDSFIHSMQKSFATGQEHHVEYPITRPYDGQERWIECRGRVIYKDSDCPEKIAGFVQDITERKRAEQRIEQLAYYDPLTQLPNRRLLLDRLERTLAVSSRSERHNALLFLDVDNFKTLNDSHGHEYGDLMLKEVAHRLSLCLRKGDTLARIGGDEFMLIAERLDEDPLRAASQTALIGKKIIKSLTKTYQLNDICYESSISIGVVLFNDDRLSTSELMKQADIAMYQAKRDGRNTLRFFNPQMQKQISLRVEMEAELRQAIQQQQLRLFLQPQVNTDSQITGAEALVRWQHPERGLILPGEFIPLAEETGLIIPIGEWVLNEACQLLKEWQQSSNAKQLNLSVNVSSYQFKQRDFVSVVENTVNRNQVTPRGLKIELTESHLLEDIEKSIKQMTELERFGIQFSLDDFGTGYSSLQYLKRLPIYQLKIDRSFVCDLVADINDQIIVRTIISMARSLGLDVLAEGVETDSQKRFLVEEGCQSFQGYSFSRPIPAQEFIRLL